MNSSWVASTKSALLDQVNSSIEMLTNHTILANVSNNHDLHWSTAAGLWLFILVGGVLTNGSVLLLYLLQPSLCTPFAIYLINLFTANLIEITVRYPIDLINQLYDTWWTGWASCTVSIYWVYVVQGAMCNAHGLIALNRLWAITYPHSYRQKHTRRFAVAVCIGCWTYLHACLLPGVIMDAMYYRLPLSSPNWCSLNTKGQLLWLQIVQGLIYCLPVAVVLLAYPVICYQTWRQWGRRVAATARVGNLVTVQPTVSKTDKSVATKHRSRSFTGGVPKRHGRDARKNHGFLILTAMTCCVLVCYGPLTLFYNVLLFGDYSIPHLYSAGVVLYELTGVFDPVLVVLAFSDLRKAFLRTYLGCFN